MQPNPPRVIQVIETHRDQVTDYHTLDGELLASSDPEMYAKGVERRRVIKRTQEIIGEHLKAATAGDTAVTEIVELLIKLQSEIGWITEW